MAPIATNILPSCHVAVSESSMRALGSFESLTRLAVRVAAALKSLAPYAAIELLLPGGSLMAFLLWLYRRRKRIEPR